MSGWMRRRLNRRPPKPQRVLRFRPVPQLASFDRHFENMACHLNAPLADGREMDGPNGRLLDPRPPFCWAELNPKWKERPGLGGFHITLDQQPGNNAGHAIF